MKFWKIFCALFLLTGLCQAKTLVFNPSDAYQLQEALSQLNSGDEVIFESGKYRLSQGLRISGLSNVSFRCRGRVELLVSDLDSAVIALEQCERIRLEGFRARHVTPAKNYQCEGAVVRLSRCRDILVAGNELNGCGAAGVYAQDSKGIIVYKNRIFNNTFAGVWVNSSQVTIHKNRIYKNASAVITYGDCEISLTENRIEDNQGNIFTSTSYFKEVVGP